MNNKHTRWAAIALLTVSLGACVSAHRANPEPIYDAPTQPDAETLTPEFHGATVGHDALRGSLPSE